MATSSLAPSTHAVLFRASSARADRLILPILLVLALAAGCWSRGPLDGHEVLVAQTAREMLATGDFILPQFAGQPRLQKPPLAYWLAALCFQATGHAHPFVARLPSLGATLGTMALLGYLGKRWFSDSIGSLSAALHATTLWVLWFGSSATVDSLLTFLVALAITLGTHDLADRSTPRREQILGFWLTLGMGVLAKGPLAIPLVLPIVIMTRTIARGERFFFRLATLVGIALFAIVSLTWPILVLQRIPVALEIWRGQSVDRYFEHYGPQTRGVGFYLTRVPLLTLPWSIFWIVELWAIIRRPSFIGRSAPAEAPAKIGRLLMSSWLLWGMLFFSLSQGKRDHYILPVLPAATVLGALGLVRLSNGWPSASALASRLTRPTIGWVAVAILVVGAQWTVGPISFARRATLELIERQRSRIDRADRVIQYGSGDRWTAFPIARPMTWPRSSEELLVEIRFPGDSLILAPRAKANELQSLGYVIVDELREPRSPSERAPSRDYALWERRATAWKTTAGTR